MQNIEHVRHTLAHLLAAAVLKLYPDAKRTIGPAIDTGFYYDFEFSKPISDEDLPKIEATMKKLLPSWKSFSHKEVNEKEARALFKDNPYKLELINEIVAKGETITLYTAGDFTDLCRGGHVDDPSAIDTASFKLEKLAGAYWRGDEKNKMLTRIYGFAFETPEALESHAAMIEEAKKRDHKVLGPQLDLFMFHPTAPGMPYWLPKGVVLYNELIHFWRTEHRNRGYQEIVSPILNKKELYVTSGHFEHYWPEMFVAKMEDGEEYGVKAMNCPNAMVVFGSRPHSYRELPLRLSDTDPLHRYERSGVLNGLLRVREFRQDDAHIFVTEEQIGEECERIFEIVERFYSVFGMNYRFRLGTRPKSFLGDIETWNLAEKTLETILRDSKKEYEVLQGDGAFYGPKIDILMRDVLGREWQMGTIQLDFQQPRRFELEYAAADGSKKTPVVIHRVIYGSMERFIGILIEHYGGAFPLWLAPVQVAILPITDKQIGYANEIAVKLSEANIRFEKHFNSETIGKKIRAAELMKIPFLLIVGPKEADSKGMVAVRQHGKGDLGALNISSFIEKISSEIQNKIDK